MDQALDPLLVTLIRLVEQRDKDGKALADIPMVLHVGGLIILGTLIPERVFAESSAGTIKALSQLHEEALADVAVASDISLGDISGGTPHFIHLKNVQFQVPGGPAIPADSTELWRGRLDRIDGFCLGDSL